MPSADSYDKYTSQWKMFYHTTVTNHLQTKTCWTQWPGSHGCKPSSPH